MVLMPRHRLSSLHLGSVLLALCLASPLLHCARADTKDLAELKPAPAAFNKAVPENIADLKAMQTHVRALAARVMPAVVNIKIGPGQGSGVIVSADGFILTAGHVSGAPGRVARITLADGREVKGKTLGNNSNIDSG